MEVPGLAEEAVLLVGTVRAAVLVVAAVRARVTRSIPGTGELVLLAGRAVQLISPVGTVPVPVTPLLLRVAAPVPPARNLPGQAEPVHLQNHNTVTPGPDQNPAMCGKQAVQIDHDQN